MGASQQASISRPERVAAVPATMAGAGEPLIEGGKVDCPATCLKTEVAIGLQAGVRAERIERLPDVGAVRVELGRRWHPAWARGPGKWRRKDNGPLYRSPGPRPDRNDRTTGHVSFNNMRGAPVVRP